MATAAAALEPLTDASTLSQPLYGAKVSPQLTNLGFGPAGERGSAHEFSFSHVDWWRASSSRARGGEERGSSDGGGELGTTPPCMLDPDTSTALHSGSARPSVTLRARRGSSAASGAVTSSASAAARAARPPSLPPLPSLQPPPPPPLPAFADRSSAAASPRGSSPIAATPDFGRTSAPLTRSLAAAPALSNPPLLAAVAPEPAPRKGPLLALGNVQRASARASLERITSGPGLMSERPSLGTARLSVQGLAARASGSGYGPVVLRSSVMGARGRRSVMGVATAAGRSGRTMSGAGATDSLELLLDVARDVANSSRTVSQVEVVLRLSLAGA